MTLAIAAIGEAAPNASEGFAEERRDGAFSDGGPRDARAAQDFIDLGRHVQTHVHARHHLDREDGVLRSNGLGSAWWERPRRVRSRRPRLVS